METRNHSIRVDDGVWDWLQELPAKTGTRSLNDALQSLMQSSGSNDSELLELVKALPDESDISLVVEETLRRVSAELRQERQAQTPASAHGSGFDPASVSGIQRGMPPRRETGTERVIRERQERQGRATAMDSTAQLVGRDDITVEDEFVGN